MRKPTFDEISSFNEYRANHVALVQKLGRAALDMDFSDHDHDKIEATGKDQELLTLRFLYKKGKIKVSDEDKNTLRKVSAKHALNSKHHAEYWDTEINIRNFNEEDKNIIHATNMPKRYIAEMACDWSACALYHNEPIFKWFNKVINKYLFFTDNQIEYLEDCLKKIVKAIGKESISFPGVRYTATQIPPKDWKKEKLEEASKENKPKLTDINKAKDILEDEILDNQNLSLENDSLKKPGKNKDWNIFSGIVKPTDEYRRDHHFSLVKNKVDKLEGDNNSELKGYEPTTGRGAENEGFTFDKPGVSDTTPAIILTFNDPDLDKYFKVALAFKDRADQKNSSIQTSVVENLTAEALCCYLYNRSIPENFFDREIKDVNPGQLESWKETIVKTSEGLINSGYLDSNEKYYVCREDNIYSIDNSGNVQLKTNKDESIHTIIDSLVTRRPDIFSKGARKDAWNPSDIYAIKESKYQEFCNIWNEMIKDTTTTRDNFNAYLRTCIQDKSVVGISLKKLSEIFEIEDVNVSDDIYKGARSIEPPEVILIPDMAPFTYDRNEIKTRSGVYFNCKANMISSNGTTPTDEIINYAYRRFTKELSLSLELQSNRSSGRLGKTPVALVNDFKEDNNVEMTRNDELGNPMDMRVGSDYNKWAQSMARNLLSQDILDKVRYISGEDTNNSNPFEIKEPNDIQFNESNWRKYALSISASDKSILDSKDALSINKIYIWPKFIDMLYALSYSQAHGRIVQDLSNLYDWSKKRGPQFAPYILVH